MYETDMQILEDMHEESKARMLDPDACDICGGWLHEDKQAPVGKAHYHCYQSVLAEWFIDEDE